MEEYQSIVSIIALTLGASWASGINLYATIAMLGISSATGSFELPPDLQILAEPIVIIAASAMYVVEFFADKIPGVDSAWDSLHTFIRIPAGTMLAAGSMGEMGPELQLAAAILGGTLATSSHAAKAGTRVIINTSPEPFTNWTASVVEDVAVVGGMWAAMYNPWLFFGMLAVFIMLLVIILPKIWQAIKGIFRFIGKLFGAEEPAQSASQSQTGNHLDQLKKLKDLFDSGALTEEEFQQQKTKLLKNQR